MGGYLIRSGCADLGGRRYGCRNVGMQDVKKRMVELGVGTAGVCVVGKRDGKLRVDRRTVRKTLRHHSALFERSRANRPASNCSSDS